MDKPFPAYQGDQPYVFVSYAHADTELVYVELARLTDQGFNIWYDEGISPGTVWRDELARAIERCSVFLLFVSEGTNASQHCMKELNFALDNDRALLAVHLDASEPSPGLRLSLSDRQAILKYELGDAAYQTALDDALRRQLPESREPAIAPAPSRSPKRNPRAARFRLATAALIVVGLGVGVVAWLASDRPAMQPSDESADTALPFADRPAIAVLPFKNMSGDEDDAYFVYGLTEDLTDRLAMWRQFPVIGTLSSRAYGNESVDPHEVARELGARYLVQGSIRRGDETLRINIQLYDAVSGQQIWSERYDRSTDDVLSVQDEIGSSIVAEMYPQLDQFDQRRAMSRHPDDMTAWDLTQKGWWHFARESRIDNGLALAAYQQAVERDPRYATAAAGLALAHYQSVSGGWAEAPEQSIERLVESAERSVVLDHLDPISQHALGHAYALNGNRQGMIQAFNTSLELNPSNALVAICAGEGFAMAGESQAAIQALESAMSLSPRDPFAFWTYHALAMAHFAEGRNEEAIVWARRSLAHNPEFAFGYRTLATVLANDGQLDAAREALARATEIEPEFTYASGRRVMRTGSPEFAERYMGGLRLAGFE